MKNVTAIKAKPAELTLEIMYSSFFHPPVSVTSNLHNKEFIS
jgi:hypothetical protein